MSTPITENTTIFDIFDYAFSNIEDFSFFKAIIEAFTPNLDLDSQLTDIDYIYSHSADKLLSPFFYRVLKAEGINNLEEMDQGTFAVFQAVLLNRYFNKWKRLYDALVTTTYEPDENYNMIEERTVTGTATTTTTEEINQKTIEKIDVTRNIDNSDYGYNSSSAVPVSKGVETNKTGTSGNTVELQTQGDGNVTTTTSELEPYKLTRHGNIGVTTNQQMITQELELRKNDFIEIMFADVDSTLCSKIYN